MIESITPSGILSKFIKNYIIVEIESSNAFLPKERVYPIGNATMVFHYGNPSKFQQKNSCEFVEPNLVICGQQTSYYDLSLAGRTGMILIVFKPHGLKSFFSFPAVELLNENLSLGDILNNEAAELEDRLFNARNNQERIILLEDFLTKSLIYNNEFERVEHSLKMINNFHGQIKVKEVASEVCLGIKQFERSFSKYVGVTPKKYASIVRLKNVIEVKRKHKCLSMSQLAYESGYYDQAHFIHDFKNLTGLTPKTFFSERK